MREKMKKLTSKFFAALFVLSALVITSCNTSKVGKNQTPLKQNPEIVNGVLENGMSYYILQNWQPQNRISLRLVVKTGSCMEEEDQKGVAHFIEHLCFNGTEHFEKNTLIDYAESIGMAFGPEVNAYTSFEETVFMLEIPADNPEFLEKALLIFHDWASAVSFDPEELEKERGVITEEWRTSRGLNSRITDSIVPFELKDSGYVDHLPIGHMDIINSISRERVIDFYEKWYRPELMSVVISGACDPKSVKYQIEQTMKDIPASKEKITAPAFSVPVRTEKDAVIFKDPEMPYIQAQFVSQQEDNAPLCTEEAFRKSLAKEIFGYVINARLSEITQTADAPWLAASIANYSETNSAAFNGMAFVPKDGMFVQAMQRLFDEYDHFNLFGVTESELQRAKDYIISSVQQNYDRRSSITSTDRVSAICSQILGGHTCISDQDRYELATKYANEITVDEINALANELLQDRGTMAMIYAPESAELPSKEDLINFWQNYTSEAEIQAYNDDVAEGDIMVRPEQKAQIISKNEIEELNATEYVFENGAKVIVKKTDFDNDLIVMEALSKGGCSLVADEEYPSIAYSALYTVNSGIGSMSISQLQKYLADKNLSLNVNIADDCELITGSTANKNVEILLQILNQLMTAPRFSDDTWNYVYSNAQTLSNSYNLQPEDTFNNKINTTLYEDTVRYRGIDSTFVSLLDKDLSQKLYKERFANAADFTFFFVGDLDEETLVDLCCYYIGTMPSDETRETYEERKYNFPSGTREIIKQGQENKGQVFIGFGGKLPCTDDVNQIWKDNEMIEQLRSLLDIRLREVIREDKSGTYGVGVTAGIYGDKERHYEINISFGCEPEREDELTNEVISVINSLRSEEVSQAYVDKLHESWRRSFETNARDNWWTLNELTLLEVWKSRPLVSFSDDYSVISWTTASELKALANKYLDTNNYVTFYLQPAE